MEIQLSAHGGGKEEGFLLYNSRGKLVALNVVRRVDRGETSELHDGVSFDGIVSFLKPGDKKCTHL